MRRSAPPSSLAYLKNRLGELASPATRASTEPLAAWAEHHIRLDGRPFSFEGHAYLRALYDDGAQHIVLEKASQVGGTVWALLRAFKACLEGLSVAYYFPTRTDVIDFSKSRVAPLIAANDFLARAVSDTDTAGLKRIGPGMLYLRGMQSQVGMKSIPVDLLVFDELDEATPEAKAMARERLAHSDFRRIIELSNPSLPGYGIDEAYQASDQRHWTVKCPACSHWTVPDKAFPVKLAQEIPILRRRANGDGWAWACPDCDGELDMEQGQWVADFPDRPIHGYRISQIHSSKVPPGEILTEYQSTRHPDRFYNLKIGIAWADSSNRVTPSEVVACCGEHLMLDSSDEPCTMGVDTGRDLHVVVSRWQPGREHVIRQVIWVGTLNSYSEIDAFVERYQVDRCVIDALPEIHATRALAERHAGTVFQNYFNENQRGAAAWDWIKHIVQENRTEALDASRSVIRERRVVLPRRGRIIEEFARHLSHDAKQLKEDEDTGAQKYSYIRTGVNHWSMAFTYDCLAWAEDTGPIIDFL